MYGRRVLRNDESSNFIQKIQSLRNNVGRIDYEYIDLANSIEEKLDYLGYSIMSDELKPDAQECINYFKDINSKVWILSGDSEDNTRFCAKKLKLISNYDPLVIRDRDSLKETIINILRIFKKELENNQKRSTEKRSSLIVFDPQLEEGTNKYSLFIDGEILDDIFQDKYLENHFSLCCFLSGSVIAFNMSPDQKGQLVRMIRTNFYRLSHVIAVGDGHNDSIMLQAADIGMIFLICI